MYKVFSSRIDNLLESLGLARFVFWYRIKYIEFWAVRGINLSLKRGQRIGIIGRNGAGKTTLLKLITENLTPTEGKAKVVGQVQALMEAGTGFHPEFTGYENVRSALIYQNQSTDDIERAVKDIEEFTELGDFLKQPFKTYSAGMQARLIFATATAIKPEIVIVDEMLGAGDAYFFHKCNERMRSLVDSGASIILVSHDLEQITMVCDQAIWMDRGKIVKQGPSLEIVKSYQRFIRNLNERRLKAKNRKMSSFSYDSLQYDGFGDSLEVLFTVEGEKEKFWDISEVILWREDQVEDRLLIGEAQDADTSHSSFVITDNNDWSLPDSVSGKFFRRITSEQIKGQGRIVFHCYGIFPDTDYKLEIQYRCSSSCQPHIEVSKNGSLELQAQLPATQNWTSEQIALEFFKEAETAQQDKVAVKKTPSLTKSRWPGEGSLQIERVLLLGSEGREQTVYAVNSRMKMAIIFKACKSGAFDIISTATMYRLDGLLVSNHVAQKVTLELQEDEQRKCYLDFGNLNLGNGNYVFTVALYKYLHHQKPSFIYDLIDRSYEFEVFGNQPFSNGIFQHTGNWSFE